MFPSNPEETPAHTESTLPDRPAQDDITVVLAGIWQKMFNVPAVALDDDFVALGGDSMSAIQLQFHVYDVFGVDVALHLLLENSRLDRMAQCVMREIVGPGPDPSAGRDEIARLTDAEIEALFREP